MDDVISRTYEVACCELDELNKKGGNYDVKEIEVMGELVDIIKDINGMQMGYESEYSQMNRSYDNGRSYGRGYSGKMMPMYNRGSSYNSGYSRDESKTMMLEHLSNVADMATDEKDRKAVMRLMEQMQSN